MPGSAHAIGFDIDLTLIDTRARILSSAVAGFADVGACIDAASIVPHLGIPLAHKAAALAPHIDPDAFAAAYRRHYSSSDAPPVLAYPGSVAALRAVRTAGYRVVVISAKEPDVASAAIAEVGLAELVDAVHGGLFAEQKGTALLTEGACAYVGDHPADMLAARHAHAIAVGVSTGAHDRGALIAAGADAVLTDLEAFPGWLDAHLARSFSPPADSTGAARA